MSQTIIGGPAGTLLKLHKQPTASGDEVVYLTSTYGA